MRFLEYVVDKLMGLPNASGRWRCPFHPGTHPSFRILPYDPRFRDRWRCGSCDGCDGRGTGDELDLLERFFPNEDFSARLLRRAKMKKAFNKQRRAGTLDLKEAAFGRAMGEIV